MGNTANLREYVDCCFCTHRDLKASHYFDDDKSKNDVETKDANTENIKNIENNDSSLSDIEFPSKSELEEFNEKFDKKFEKYKQIPKTSIILYKSGLIE
jgi:hypothetical protein